MRRRGALGRGRGSLDVFLHDAATRACAAHAGEVHAEFLREPARERRGLDLARVGDGFDGFEIRNNVPTFLHNSGAGGVNVGFDDAAAGAAAC